MRGKSKILSQKRGVPKEGKYKVKEKGKCFNSKPNTLKDWGKWNSRAKYNVASIQYHYYCLRV